MIWDIKTDVDNIGKIVVQLIKEGITIEVMT